MAAATLHHTGTDIRRAVGHSFAEQMQRASRRHATLHSDDPLPSAPRDCGGGAVGLIFSPRFRMGEIDTGDRFGGDSCSSLDSVVWLRALLRRTDSALKAVGDMAW
jgi:hypothetical protein